MCLKLLSHIRIRIRMFFKVDFRIWPKNVRIRQKMSGSAKKSPDPPKKGPDLPKNVRIHQKMSGSAKKYPDPPKKSPDPPKNVRIRQKMSGSASLI